MEDMNGKVAVVTGGASGIGLALGRAFAAQGMKVVLADIEGDTLEKAGSEMPEGTEVELVRCDVSDAEQVDALRDAALGRFGAVHVVCNNAGVGSGGLMWEVPLADWDWVLGVNLMGVVHGIRAFTPLFIEQGEGHVVNTASMAGVTSPPYMGPYNASKHAVVTMSETLYSDLQISGHTGVGVTALCPGWVQTRIHESSRNRPGSGAGTDGDGEGDGDGLRGVVGDLIANGLEAGHVADLVVDAVRANRFYVLTHPEWIAGVTARVERMMAGEQPAVILPT